MTLMDYAKTIHKAFWGATRHPTATPLPLSEVGPRTRGAWLAAAQAGLDAFDGPHGDDDEFVGRTMFEAFAASRQRSLAAMDPEFCGYDIPPPDWARVAHWTRISWDDAASALRAARAEAGK